MAWRTARNDENPKGKLFRLIHEQWLNRALRSRIPYPRIPVRKVDEGGFDRVHRNADARAHADRWWALALDRVDSGELGPLEEEIS
jgi:hypothetical protein